MAYNMFPLSCYDANNRQDITFANIDELYNWIEENSNYSKDGKVSYGKYLYENVLWNLGIDNEQIPVNVMCDKRTWQIIQAFTFYEFNPHLAFNYGIWYELFPLLKKIFEPMRLI